MKTIKTAYNLKDERLATNWYKNNYRECSRALLRVLTNYGYNLKHRDDTYGEFVFSRTRDTLEVKVIMFEDNEASIDFVLKTKKRFDFGKSKNIIADIYDKLSRELNRFRK